MGFFTHLFFPWGILLQVLAIIHFIRRRPNGWWLFVIIFFGLLGAVVYLLVEAAPDLSLLPQSYRSFSRRRRVAELEALVQVNNAVGNWEELGDLYMDRGKLAQARAAFDRAIALGSTTVDPFYRRGVCAVLTGDAAAGVPDLERVVEKDPEYDFHRAAGLLAHAYAQSGQKDKADTLFRQATKLSTLPETYMNYAEMLAAEGRTAEARTWAQKILDNIPAMPRYLRRRERPWFRRARKLLRRLPS